MSHPARNFLFTWNFPYELITEHDFDDCIALVYQEEIGEETGTPHLQGYVRFSRKLRVNTIKNMLVPTYPTANRIHFETARGTPTDNYNYCTKEGTRTDPSQEPYVFGEFDAGQGKRSDIVDLRNAIRDQKSIREIYDDDSLVKPAGRYQTFLKSAIDVYQAVPARPNVRVRLCLGTPGTGKTYCCEQLADGQTPADIYWKDGESFWERYNGESIVIMDEFGGHIMPPLLFNRVCDKYPYTVPKKGGSHPLLASDIRITANHSPQYWWGHRTNYDPVAVARRIHEVHYHAAIGECIVYEHTYDERGIAVEYALDKFFAGNHHLPPPQRGAE